MKHNTPDPRDLLKAAETTERRGRIIGFIVSLVFAAVFAFLAWQAQPVHALEDLQRRGAWLPWLVALLMSLAVYGIFRRALRSAAQELREQSGAAAPWQRKPRSGAKFGAKFILCLIVAGAYFLWVWPFVQRLWFHPPSIARLQPPPSPPRKSAPSRIQAIHRAEDHISQAKQPAPGNAAKESNWLDSFAERARMVRPRRASPPPVPPEPIRKLIEAIKKEPSPCPALMRSASTLAHVHDHDRVDAAVRNLILCKWRRPSYERAKNESLLFYHPWPSPWPEDAQIHRLIAQLERLRQPGGDVFNVPRIKEAEAPAVDGILEKREWEHALMLASPGSRTLVLALHDGKRLYLGVDVPENTKADSMNELMVRLHTGVSSAFRDEYFFVYSDGRTSLPNRSALLRWPGAPEDPNSLPRKERWKAFSVHYEGGVFPTQQGATQFTGHRSYEVAIDLAEAAIPQDASFPLGLVIELAPAQTTDPRTGKPRFQHRRYVMPFQPVYDGGRGWVARLRLQH